MSKAYVLLSGGIDSSTCLAEAQQYNGTAKGITFNYGQRHQNELNHARLVAHHLGCDLVSHDIQNVIGHGGLTDPELEMPNASYADLPEGISPTYVPFRNGLLLSIAASIASADPEAEYIYYGAHAEDAENDAYPDCSVPFINAMAEAINIGTYGKIDLVAPLQHMTKAEVITMGNSLNVPWHLTWSCYEGRDIHCGICPTCRSRREGFQLAGIIDPTLYAEDY